MKYNYFYFSFALFLSACASDEQIDSLLENNVVSNFSGVVMNIPDFVSDESATRTNLVPTASSVEFSWKEGDQVGIYTESTSMANFDIDQISQDAKSATFNGGGFSLTEGSTYYAFYPYDAASTSKTSVAVDYTGQTQTANNDCSHLAAYDFMVAKAAASGPNEASFDFGHLSAIAKFKISLPQDGTFTSFMISSEMPVLTKGTVDLTMPSASISSSQSSNNVVLELNDIQSASKTLTAYLMLPPTNMSGVEMTCTLKDKSDNIYIGTIAGKNMQAGNAYGYNCTLISSPSNANDRTAYVNGHLAVDLGLSVRWASTNIGASMETEYGDYFAWGETEVKNTAAYWSNYSLCNGTNTSLTKYCLSNRYGIVDNKQVLDAEDDAAHVLWSDNWVMPSVCQWIELCQNCVAEETSVLGVEGIKYTASNGNYIFIPYSGCWESGDRIYYQGGNFSLWLNSVFPEDYTNKYGASYNGSINAWACSVYDQKSASQYGDFYTSDAGDFNVFPHYRKYRSVIRPVCQ